MTVFYIIGVNLMWDIYFLKKSIQRTDIYLLNDVCYELNCFLLNSHVETHFPMWLYLEMMRKRLPLFLSVCVHRRKATWGHSKEVLSASMENRSYQKLTLQAPWSWTFGLQNYETMNFGCLSHPVTHILFRSLRRLIQYEIIKLYTVPQ
jgi:hypothetical protein